MKKSVIPDPSMRKGEALWFWHVARVEAEVRHTIDILRNALDDLEEVKKGIKDEE